MEELSQLIEGIATATADDAAAASSRSSDEGDVKVNTILYIRLNSFIDCRSFYPF